MVDFHYMEDPMAQRSGMAAAHGGLEQYRARVVELPYLGVEEERALVARLRDEHDLEAAHRLVCAHLRMVAAIARGYTGYGLPQDDLIQEGTVGLMKAVKRFDGARGVRLASFAAHWIHAEIREYVVRNWRLVKVATTKAQRKLFFNLRSLRPEGSLQRGDVKRIAKQLHVQPEDVSEMDARLAGGNAGAYRALDDEAVSQLPVAEPEPSEAVEALQTKRLRAQALAAALAGLDERSRRIVEQRWLRDGKAAGLKELGAEFKVSAERIRQIQRQAFAAIRERLQSQGAGRAWSIAS